MNDADRTVLWARFKAALPTQDDRDLLDAVIKRAASSSFATIMLMKIEDMLESNPDQTLQLMSSSLEDAARLLEAEIKR